MNTQRDNLLDASRSGQSDEAFADLLSTHGTSIHGTSGPEESAEVLRLRSALSSYRAEALQWAERRSATQPSLALAAQRGRRWAAVPQWTLVAIALVTLAAGVVHLSAPVSEPGQGASAPVAVLPSASAPVHDLAEDNRLLSSIDEALSYHNTSPVDPTDLRTNAGEELRRNLSQEATD